MENPQGRQPPSPERRHTLGGRLTSMRMLQVKGAGMVVVYVQDPSTAAPGVPELVFESATAKTHLTTFPPDWHVLSDEQLVALWRARTA